MVCSRYAKFCSFFFQTLRAWVGNRCPRMVVPPWDYVMPAAARLGTSHMPALVNPVIRVACRLGRDTSDLHTDDRAVFPRSWGVAPVSGWAGLALSRWVYVWCGCVGGVWGVLQHCSTGPAVRNLTQPTAPSCSGGPIRVGEGVPGLQPLGGQQGAGCCAAAGTVGVGGQGRLAAQP